MRNLTNSYHFIVVINEKFKKGCNGSDFSCHQYPAIQKTVVEYNFFWPALIIGFAIIVAAWIFKSPRQETRVIEKIEVKEPKEANDISEPYYKSNSNIRTP
ncbi:hypothetical protein HYX07_03880 [Candidatus Woesearchaeota archaeon]|nr:hypothetical protein [Candidatus Woesearchaeota archaeon]